jgi:hypothetical protein
LTKTFICDMRSYSQLWLITNLEELYNTPWPHLDKLISHSQSAFIKGRSIQDNFQYIKDVVNHFHQAKTPMLLLKLDIVKFFDNVR